MKNNKERLAEYSMELREQAETIIEMRAEIEKLRAALVRIDGEASQGAPNSLIEEIAQKAMGCLHDR